MKISDLHVAESHYNTVNNIEFPISKLHYPQKYLMLRLGDGELYNLKITESHKDSFILEIDGRVSDGKR